PPVEPAVVSPSSTTNGLSAAPLDTAAPYVAFTSAPPNGARLTSPTVRLAGSARENMGVDHVEVVLHDGPGQSANGTVQWSVQVMLVPGYNLVRVRSVDLAGNRSAEIRRALTYVTVATLTVQTNGLGLVSPGLDGKQLEVGRAFRIRAVP